jgi:hypothetical protein
MNVEDIMIPKNNQEFQRILKELGLDNKQSRLTKHDFTRIYGYMQEVYCLG